MTTPVEWTAFLQSVSAAVQTAAASGATAAEQASIAAQTISNSAAAMGNTAQGLLSQIARSAQYGSGASRAAANQIFGSIAGHSRTPVAAARALISNSLRTGATQVVAGGATTMSTAATAVGWGTRLLIGGLLVTGIVVLIYLGKRYYDRQNRPVAGNSTQVKRDDADERKPVSGGSKSKDNREPGDFRPMAKRTPPTRFGNRTRKTSIEVPSHIGVEELVPKPPSKSSVVVAAGGAQIARRKQWEKTIDSKLPIYKMDGPFKGSFAAPKAEFRQEGSEVSGHIWIATGSTNTHYVTRKVPVSYGQVLYRRGEIAELKLDLGFTRTVLNVQRRGRLITGEIDGVMVVFDNATARKLREQLEKKYPFKG